MYRACLSTFLDRSDPSPSTTCSMVCVGPGGVMRFSTRHRIHIDPTEHGANPLQGGKGLRQAGFRLPGDLLKHPLLICLGIMQLDGKGECLSRLSSLGTQLGTTRSSHHDHSRAAQQSCGRLVCRQTWHHTLHSASQHMSGCSASSW